MGRGVAVRGAVLAVALVVVVVAAVLLLLGMSGWTVPQ